jgi:hypothetical protein
LSADRIEAQSTSLGDCVEGTSADERHRREWDVDDGPHIEGPPIAGRGKNLFAVAGAHDLEGIVAKPANGRHYSDGTSTNWIKIKNPGYTQMTARHELFERRNNARAKRVPVLRVP